MSDAARPGTIVWTDLTVADAPALRDFYAAVVGWRSEPVSMGAYADFNMLPPQGGAPVTGICHAREGNAGLPPVWLIYVAVASLDDAMRTCTERGGKVVDGPRPMGAQRFCVIQDPAGACVGLIAPR